MTATGTIAFAPRESLRRVEVLRYETSATPTYRKHVGYVGRFHQWIVVDEKDYNNDYHRIAVAIVETPEGEINFEEPHMLRFLP